MRNRHRYALAVYLIALNSGHRRGGENRKMAKDIKMLESESSLQQQRHPLIGYWG